MLPIKWLQILRIINLSILEQRGATNLVYLNTPGQIAESHIAYFGSMVDTFNI